MTTPAADALPTDNPHAVAVPAGAIEAPTGETLLTRVHARLSELETTIAAALHRFEHTAESVLEHIKELRVPVTAVASEIAAAAPPPISTVAAEIAALCSCGHVATSHNSLGGCVTCGKDCASA